MKPKKIMIKLTFKNIKFKIIFKESDFIYEAPLSSSSCHLEINLISIQFNSSLPHPMIAPSYITYTDLPISTFGYLASYCWNVLLVKINSDLKQ